MFKLPRKSWLSFLFIVLSLKKLLLQLLCSRIKVIYVFQSLEKSHPSHHFHTYSLFAPFGATHLNKFREKIYNSGIKKGYSFISYISPDAKIYTTDIGNNCFILENNVIQPYVKIGNNCVLWSGNHIGHHSTIEDHVFITSHVVISGNCIVKKYSYLGVNSTLKDSIIINESSVIGMASCITRNTESYNIYMGIPGKIFKKCDDSISL